MAVILSILLSLADIYSTGHGGRTITGPLLAAAAIAAGIAWRRSGRPRV